MNYVGPKKVVDVENNSRAPKQTGISSMMRKYNTWPVKRYDWKYYTTRLIRDRES